MPSRKRSQTRSKTGKRSKRGKSYFTRNKKGQFKSFVSIGKSLAADMRRRARKKVSSGYGHKGDR